MGSSPTPATSVYGVAITIELSLKNNKIMKKTKKQKSLKILFVVTVLFVLMTVVYFVFRALGLDLIANIFGEADNSRFEAFFYDFGIWVIAIFLVIYLLQAIFLCAMPGNTIVFLLLGMTIFMSAGINFFVAIFYLIICVWITAIILFYLGRFGGKRLLYWMFGQELVDKHLQTMSDKGTKIAPLLMVIPLMPNDLVCLLCGMSKMKMRHFLLIVIFARSLEVVVIWLYPWAVYFFTSEQSPQMIIVVINLMVINMFLIYHYYKWFLKLINKHILRRDYVLVEKPYFEEVLAEKPKP